MQRTEINTALVVIYTTVVLDAAGIGLVFPILPRLLEAVTQTQDVAPYIGIMTALYAVMQFVFAPMLGSLSDKLGRRPVLLLSLAGAAINYAVMAFAPQLWMLLLGRAIAGLTSANVSVASAYLTDISAEHERARRFGQMSAMAGAGFIVGPVLGGLLGDQDLRLPFIVAGALNAANFCMAWRVLPETRKAPLQVIEWAALNPLRPLRWVFEMQGIVPILLVFFLLSGAGEAYGSCWALWGFDSFGWSGFWIGLSLGAFGVCQTFVQAFLPGPATRLLGERWASVIGILSTCVALLALALARQGWMVFAIMPMFALGGIGTPAFMALATRQVDAARQGQLQGVLASVVSLASIVAPLGFSSFYLVVQKSWPGAVWLSVIVVNLIAIPLVFLGTRSARIVSAAGE